MRRDRSPIPPPREPKRDPYAMQREREMGRPGPPPSRRRSPSPHDRGGYKRHRHEDEYYDRHDRYGSPPRHHRGRSPDYGRYDEFDPYYGPPPHRHPPPPPPKRHGEPHSRGGGGGSGPKTFKQYLLDEVPENVTPQQAQAMYENYLTRFFGDQLRAKFETEKNNEEVRARYHPSSFEASLVLHREEAAATAALLAGEIAEGRYDPHLPGFNQGCLEPAEGEEPPKPPKGQPEAPPCLWKPDRVAADYRAAARLAAFVDAQRGLKLANNPLLPAPGRGADDDMAVDDGAGANGAGNADFEDAANDGAAGEGGAEAGGGAGAAAAVGGSPGGAIANGEGGPDPALPRVLAAIEAEEVLCEEEEEALLSRLGALDQLLTWLWRVHGIDYYGGRELLLASDYMARGGVQRTLRGPRPEEGEEQDEDEAKKDRAQLAERVDKKWAARMEGPDPLLLGAQREEIEKRLDDFVESQIKQENEKKWGSTFSNKFFLEKRFVVKHIQNKHGARLDEQRATIRDELYWQAYEADKKAAHARARAVEQQRDSAAAASMQAAAAAADAAYEGEWQEGGEGEEGAGRGRGTPMRGRGGMMRGGAMMMMGRGRGGMPMPPPLMGELPLVDPGMMMMGGLPGPIILPGPGMMGGLPLGAPMVLDPAALMGGGELPIFLPGPGGGRGMMRGGGGGGLMRGGGRGRGPPGGRGGMMGGAPPGTKLEGPGYLKHYYDLDAPANNRAVLDYGDL